MTSYTTYLNTSETWLENRTRILSTYDSFLPYERKSVKRQRVVDPAPNVFAPQMHKKQKVGHLMKGLGDMFKTPHLKVSQNVSQNVNPDKIETVLPSNRDWR